MRVDWSANGSLRLKTTNITDDKNNNKNTNYYNGGQRHKLPRTCTKRPKREN
eukprot:m.34555 g.34555  ORF g.34555 m.34555 type:complete len:52 (+) comp16996_c0_seq1:273-428(+)